MVRLCAKRSGVARHFGGVHLFDEKGGGGCTSQKQSPLNQRLASESFRVPELHVVSRGSDKEKGKKTSH